MNRRLFVLAAIIAAGVAALILTSRVFQPPDHLSATWLQRSFSLSAAQSLQVTAIDQQYEVICKQLCDRIEDSDRNLAKLLASSDHMTPEIAAAIEESDRVRTECRTSMLQHFYRVAEVIPAPQRKRYLDMVYPVVLHPEKMGVSQFPLREH
jgi:hypothetical protein